MTVPPAFKKKKSPHDFNKYQLSWLCLNLMTKNPIESLKFFLGLFFFF